MLRLHWYIAYANTVVPTSAMAPEYIQSADHTCNKTCRQSRWGPTLRHCRKARTESMCLIYRIRAVYWTFAHYIIMYVNRYTTQLSVAGVWACSTVGRRFIGHSPYSRLYFYYAYPYAGLDRVQTVIWVERKRRFPIRRRCGRGGHKLAKWKVELIPPLLEAQKQGRACALGFCRAARDSCASTRTRTWCFCYCSRRLLTFEKRKIEFGDIIEKNLQNRHLKM